MDANKPIFVLTCLFVALPFALTACPSKEDVSPCTCKESLFSGITVECSKLYNKDLVRVASSLRGMTVKTFSITDSKLGIIPHDVFKGVKLCELTIQSSSLVALTDRGDAFVGLEDHLEELEISHCAFKNKWDWSVLRNFKKLKDLVIEHSLRLETIGEDFKKISISSVKYLSFAGSSISLVSDHAFDSFKNIVDLILHDNKITNLKRTMLPNPALELQSFNIRNNLIEQFPDDMFIKMPNLKSLYINNNKILVLNERTFSPVWEQLDTFAATGNQFRCDCSMSWILFERSPDYFSGKCASPPELEGKELEKLTPKDFLCYV